MKKIVQKGLFLGIPVLAVIYFLFDPREYELFPRCVFYTTTGFYCPGCGSQRAIYDLFHWNIRGSVNSNILLMPAIFTVGYHYVHPFVNKIFNIKLPDFFYMKETPWVVFIIVMLFWVIRNLDFFPFPMFAP